MFASTVSRLSILLGGLFVLDARVAAQHIDAARVEGVIAGVLAWEDRGLSRFSKEDRLDRALGELLVARGASRDRLTVLLDASATRERVLDAVRRGAARAAPGSTFVFYYAGHGLRDGGEVVLASYDVRTDRARETGLAARDLAAAIAAGFRGSRVLIFADCCFSGGLEDVVAMLFQRDIPAVALTSASPWNPSTGNWTYTQMLLELLGGDPLDDANRDGVISLREAEHEIGRAMRFLELQRHGYANRGVPDTLALAAVRPPAPTPADAFVLGDYVDVREGGTWHVGRLAARIEGRYVVEVAGYVARRPVTVGPADVRACTAPVVEDHDPVALPEKEAFERATAGGKYSELLRRLAVPDDFAHYGSFRDWGRWSGSSYAGYEDLPAGYWVYVFPHWYVWDEQRS